MFNDEEEKEIKERLEKRKKKRQEVAKKTQGAEATKKSRERKRG